MGMYLDQSKSTNSTTYLPYRPNLGNNGNIGSLQSILNKGIPSSSAYPYTSNSGTNANNETPNVNNVTPTTLPNGLKMPMIGRIAHSRPSCGACGK